MRISLKFWVCQRPSWVCLQLRAVAGCSSGLLQHWDGEVSSRGRLRPLTLDMHMLIFVGRCLLGRPSFFLVLHFCYLEMHSGSGWLSGLSFRNPSWSLRNGSCACDTLRRGITMPEQCVTYPGGAAHRVRLSKDNRNTIRLIPLQQQTHYGD